MLRVHKVQRTRRLLGEKGRGQRRLLGPHGKRRLLGENGHGQLRGGGPLSAIKKFIKKNPKTTAALSGAAALGACAAFPPACAQAASAAGAATGAVAKAVGASMVATGVSKVVSELDNEEMKRKVTAKAAEKLGLGPEAEAMLSKVVDAAAAKLQDEVIDAYGKAPTTDQVADAVGRRGREVLESGKEIGRETIQLGQEAMANIQEALDLEKALAAKFNELMQQGAFNLAEQNVQERQQLIDQAKTEASIPKPSGAPAYEEGYTSDDPDVQPPPTSAEISQAAFARAREQVRKQQAQG